MEAKQCLFNPIILLLQGWNISAEMSYKRQRQKWDPITSFWFFYLILMTMLYFNFLTIFYNSGKGRGAYSLSSLEYSSSSSWITTGSGFDQGQNKRTKVVLNSGL